MINDYLSITKYNFYDSLIIRFIWHYGIGAMCILYMYYTVMEFAKR